MHKQCLIWSYINYHFNKFTISTNFHSRVTELLMESFQIKLAFIIALSFAHKLSDYIIPKSLQPDVVDIWYYKLWILLYQIVLVGNIKGLNLQVAKIWVCDKNTIPLQLTVIIRKL